MAGLDEVFKSMQRTQDLLKSAGLGSQLTKLVDAASIATNSAAMRLSEMSVNVKGQLSPLMGIQESIAQKLEPLQRFTLPPSFYNSIQLISERHSQFYEQWSSVSEALNRTMKSSQIHTLQITLGNVASQLALISAARGYWDSVEDFEEITAEVTTISERVIENEVITKADINEIKSLLHTINNKDKNIEAIVFKWLTIISFILGLISEGRNWFPKPDGATKEDIELLKKEFIQQITQLQKETKDSRITNRICKVYQKPNTKKIIIATLPKEFDIVVLQISHKWAYVTYINPKDNLTETGWVLKKYLTDEKYFNK